SADCRPNLIRWYLNDLYATGTMMTAWNSSLAKTATYFCAVLCVLLAAPALLAQELNKVPFPYGPLGLNSMPWVIAKDARLFVKNGLDVDMVYMGASSVMVQSMLAGSANIAGFAGPAIITNVLRGGDIIQVAAIAPYFTQSVMVRPDIQELR